jgi:putative ABC transport system permease protein
MITVALRGLAGRKLRAALTAFAIVLGVAMVSGTYILTDTIDKAFSNLFTETYAETDARVTGRGADLSFQGESSSAPGVPEGILERVRELPSVEVATGGIVDEQTRILDKDGDAITPDAPTFGFGVDVSPELERFNPAELVEGRWSSGANEVVIDAGTAEREGFKVGDPIKIAADGPVQEFEIAGIAQYGGVDSIGNATFAIFDVPTAQRLLNKEGKFDEIFVAARPGVSPESLVRDLREVLPQSVQVQTGQQTAQDETEEITTFTNVIKYILLAFAGIALFVGAFVIFNTLSITVAQRTREFATLRTIGASRRQVLGSVIVEALVIGFVSSLIGLGVGVGLAAGLKALFAALGAALPEVGMVFAVRTVVVSMLVGVLVTLVAGLFPALRATRVPPIAAVREGAELPPSRFSRFTPIIGVATVVLSVVLLGYAMFVDDLGTFQRLLAIAAGCLALFIGVALLSSRLVRPLATLVGWPARRIGGVAGKLAQSNAKRNPGRTAATAAALMIGIALVAFIAVLATGMKASNRDAIESQVQADYIITSQDGYSPFVAGAGEAVKASSVDELTTSVRADIGKAAGKTGYVTGIEPETIAEVYRFDWKEGSDALLFDLGRDGAIIDDDLADQKNLDVGDRFTVLTPSDQRVELTVKGIYEPPPFFPMLGNVSISKDTFDEIFERPRNLFTFVNVAGDPRPEATRNLETALEEFPDAKVQTRAEWIDFQDQDFNDLLMFLYVLLALSVIVSIFGMVNTLVLSVYERTRELGMLRAVGMTRRQVRRMVRHESVITALIGAALGLPLGIFLAALVTRALSQFDVQFKVPVDQLLIFAAISIVVGVLAAILPARRAARLNVLRALQYE